MAHCIDRLFFTASAVILVFIIALHLTGSLPAAMLAGFLAPFPLRALKRTIAKRFASSRFCLRRRRHHLARETVRCWSVQRDSGCRDDILALMRAAYPASGEQLHAAGDAGAQDIPVHVLMTLRPISEDAMADVLRRIRESGHERAAIVCTSDFSDEARALAALPQDASVALLDGQMLAVLLTKHPSAAPMRSMPAVRAKKVRMTRAHALRMLPAAAVLLAVYLLMGLKIYLPAALAVLWTGLMLLRRKNAPDALFG